jgi:hypothetical protein
MARQDIWPHPTFSIIFYHFVGRLRAEREDAASVIRFEGLPGMPLELDEVRLHLAG